ncbi:hypothetical protein PLESTF_001244200 [Pleodorina starrii]|nr:hypothetical protein PLESTM_000387300 [Pleodorina starrii]GLC72405.1 hypothetical protein PLESTF_001244200 [Pleodorina starrii]
MPHHHQQAPRVGFSTCALKGAVVVHCASSSGGRFSPPQHASANTRSLSSDGSDTSWSDTQDYALDDGLLSLSSGSSAPRASSCQGGSDDDRSDEPDSKRARLSVPASDRCKDADCARIVLRFAQSTFRADEIVGRKLVLF